MWIHAHQTGMVFLALPCTRPILVRGRRRDTTGPGRGPIRMDRVLLRIVATVVIVGALACGRETPLSPLPPAGQPLATNQTIATNATVRYVGLEGGCWALQTSVGTYSPTLLPQQFHIDGLPVYVVAHGSSASDICMIAPLVSLDTIRTP